MSTLERGENSTLITIRIDSRSDTDAKDAVSKLVAEYGIEKLDIVVANAGYGSIYGDVMQVKPGEIRDMVEINTLGDVIRPFSKTMVANA